MRTHWFACALALLPLPSVASSAQVGLLAGPHFTFVRGSDETMASAIREVLGAYGELPLSERSVLQIQLRYLRKEGGQWKKFGGGPDFEYDARYIELPVYFKHRIGAGSFRPFVFGGPAIALSFNTSSFARSSPGPIITYGPAPKVRPIEVSLSAGLGAEFDLAESITMGLAASYAYGLTPIAERSDRFQSVNSFLSVGYRWAD